MTFRPIDSIMPILVLWIQCGSLNCGEIVVAHTTPDRNDQVRSERFDRIQYLHLSVPFSKRGITTVSLTPANTIKKSSKVMPRSPTCVNRKYRRRPMKHMPMASSAHASALKFAAMALGRMNRREELRRLILTPSSEDLNTWWQSVRSDFRGNEA